MAVGTVGLINIAAGGTPVSCSPSKRIGCQSIKITPKAANAGVVYYGLKDMVTGTGVGVLGIIAKPASTTTGPFEPAEITQRDAPAGLNLEDIYLDGTTNDGAYVSYVTG